MKQLLSIGYLITLLPIIIPSFVGGMLIQAILLGYHLAVEVTVYIMNKASK